MADTSIHSTNRVTKWVDDEFREFSNGNEFKRLMGSGANAPIHVGESMVGATGGDRITRSLVLRNNSDAVMDDNELWGNEPELANYGQTLTLRQYRNAFAIGKHERRKANFDMLEAMKDMARVWNAELIRDLIIAALLSPVTDGVTTYDAATVTQRNTWATSNNPAVSNQRVLYGAAKGNYSGVHATDLANVDGTADDLHQDIVRLMRRMAQSCVPKVKPAMSTKSTSVAGSKFFMPVGSLPFRDLEANMDTIHQNADVRGSENHIFANGDISVGNVVVFEVPEMDYTTSNGGALLENVGNGGTTEVEIVPLMGAQAVLLEIGSRMRPISDSGDYNNREGVGVAETLAVAKASFNSFQHGVVTGHVSAVGD